MRIFWLFPVFEVCQIVDECSIFKETVLREPCIDESLGHATETRLMMLSWQHSNGSSTYNSSIEDCSDTGQIPIPVEISFHLNSLLPVVSSVQIPCMHLHGLVHSRYMHFSPALQVCTFAPLAHFAAQFASHLCAAQSFARCCRSCMRLGRGGHQAGVTATSP